MYLYVLTRQHQDTGEPNIAVVSAASEQEARLRVIEKLAAVGGASQEAAEFALSSTTCEQIGEANDTDYGTIYAIESTDFIDRKEVF